MPSDMPTMPNSALTWSATLKGSVGKMNDLLARLAPAPDQRPAQARADIRYGRWLPRQSPPSAAITTVMLLGDGNLWVMADPLMLEQAIGHLVQNAVDASDPREPVTVRMSRR